MREAPSSFRLMTLNMWGYHDWDNRRTAVEQYVAEQKADVIVLQEVLTNQAWSVWPSSDIVAAAGDYPFKVFAPTYQRTNSKDRAGNRTQRASYGLAIVSHWPIVSMESYFLRHYPDHDEPNSVLLCTIDIAGQRVEIVNIHVANSETHSRLHLEELVNLLSRRGSRPIIAGDYNQYDLSGVRDQLLPPGYQISTDVRDYLSMPGDNGTLDYIAVPSEQYAIQRVACPELYVSDHRPVITDITSVNE